MTAYNVYANGVFWGVFETETADQAIRQAASEHGTTPPGEYAPDTTDMVAVRADQGSDA